MCGAELKPLPKGAQRVADWLQQRGHAHLPVLLQDSTRTAQEAADTLGVQVGQVAKSIIFRRLPDEVAVLVVAAGDHRVDAAKVQALVCGQGQELARADAAFVKAQTGFSIGGVAPVAHARAVVALIDQDLARFDTIWAAAGHPHAMFQLTPAQLQALMQAPQADIAAD
ncbi:YbaK/EbsC family protein [Corticibacter populi]|uniref:YbaK/EbsC family protein n=1 Tax=Corticibacter populi TaxID=1550736 RepID=A0A3M6QUB5_9BURK|nr:YbaK/EbsC family protein [Corticibacter populi]RMX06624.1 YbaK/EbsC family protein [Corticibacter populi]RZS31805.1 prolyl-tRNA editing enzyme YbaK/EbsC (Cys-tRNA(Pro) deacylase) [Corticibacter populi]